MDAQAQTELGSIGSICDAVIDPAWMSRRATGNAQATRLAPAWLGDRFALLRVARDISLSVHR